MGSNKKVSGGNEPWKNRERHYCVVCNAWMGSDRQSILLHENGKKHKENLELSLQKKRQDRLDEEKKAQKIQQYLTTINSTALQSHVQDIGHFPLQAGGGALTTPVAPTLSAAIAPSQTITNSSSRASASTATTGQDTTNKNQNHQQKRQLKQEKADWESRKKNRLEEREKDDGEDDESEDMSSTQRGGRQRRKIGENEGYYTLGNVHSAATSTAGEDGGSATKQQSIDNNTTTYLEGIVFGDLLEEDMPIQIWTGSNAASAEEQRSVRYHHLWMDGIVAAVRKRNNNNNHDDRMVVDVAFLLKLNDNEETLEKSVPLRRIRIVLGSDEKIPTTLEEARIMAMGGEDEIVLQPTAVEQAGNNTDMENKIDESTGLSGWSTVSVKRTTVRQELREERERLRQARKEVLLAAEKEAKKASLRRMEEAKVMNADDSALGAYDVWNRGGKDGYKGVNIHEQAKINNVHELGKKLATSGTPVAFKSSDKKKKNKKQNRRTTSVDDDD
ncbi:hypothetical protein ACA910_019636 [Epithemia clementina (nom. ined.)]